MNMITTATIEILDQGISVLNKISDEDYTSKLELVYNGSIGGHYRHVLEHFMTLYECHAEGFVNYDLRKRDVSIETNRLAAIKATESLKQKFSAFSPEIYEQKLVMNGKLSHLVEESMEIETTFGRELAYSIAHANHHYAIIGVMCALLDRSTDSGFGVAPSTVRHNEKQQPLVAE